MSWQGWALRAARRAGRRGAFLAFLALLNWLYGYSLLSSPAAQQRSFDLLLPWTVWGIIWVVMGFVAASGILMTRDRFQFAAAATFKTAWGLVQFDLWFNHGQPRAWVGGVIWLALAAVVLVVAGWPEPGKVVTVPPPKNLGQPDDR